MLTAKSRSFPSYSSPGVSDVATPHADSEAIEVSVFVPVSERSEFLPQLYFEYAAPLRAAGRAFEFIFVAESRREALEPLRALVTQGEPIRLFESGQVIGETSMLRIAIGRARGRYILTLPPYRRIEADSLLSLLERADAGADVVTARRWPRRDSWLNRFQNTAFDRLARGIANGKVHDLGCGVRLMRREVPEIIPLYGDFSRFLPLLAFREGFRIDEIDAPQHIADTATRIHRPGIYLRRALDVLGLYFLLRFTEKPLRFFGFLGALSSISGLIVLAILTIQRALGHGIADRPLLLFGVLLLVLGIQAIALGLIGEIIVHLHAPSRRPYRLAVEQVSSPE